MSVFRLFVLSLLVLASVAAIGAAHITPGRVTVTTALLPDLTPPETPGRAEIAVARLKQRLTAEMRAHFDLFLYVSKSDHGPLGQHMFVVQKLAPGTLTPVYEWAASTGREKTEVNARGRRVITATPAGFYQLDPGRMYPRYHSVNWDQDMANAMFLDWERKGAQTGLAIHAAAPADIAKLGSRASGGCVHLGPENAALLQNLILANHRGPVPRFAYNHETRTRSNQGDFQSDHQGALKMADGYRVLVVLDDYGGEDAVAALF